MNEIPVICFLWLSALLFAIGIAMILLKKNTIFILMGIELMLNAANLNLIAFARNDDTNQGLLMTIFVLVVGVCEMAIALAMILQMYRIYKKVDI